MAPRSWPEAYSRLAERLPRMAATARLTLCGLNAVVDARTELHRAGALLDAADPGAARLGQLLKDRARRGVGGEVRIDWLGGPAWLAANLAFDCTMGGTGPQAAWTLTSLGARAVMPLGDRSAHMVRCLPPGIEIYQDGALVRTPDIRAEGQARSDIYIFEYLAGVSFGDVAPPRSSRVIVRLSDPGLERDDAFYRLSPGLAAAAGAGLVSGLNGVPMDQLDTAIARVRDLCLHWRKNGLDLVHLELASYDTPEALERVLAGLSGAVTSVGMSHSELLPLAPGETEVVAALASVGARLGVGRVCVHADDWAAALTTGDPERETLALMTGSLVAAARAEAGQPVARVAVPAAARFAAPPFESKDAPDGWNLACCSTPYLARPTSTLGLGDAFTAGCLLALGQAVGQGLEDHEISLRATPES